MTRRVLLFAVAAVLAVAVIIGIVVLRPPEQASAPIEAIPLAVATSAATAAPVPTNAPATEVATSAPIERATSAPAEAATSAPAAKTATAAPAETSSLLFEIVPAESQTRFKIDEVLRGADVEVVGVTDQVAGQISIDPTNPSKSQVGVIQINARTLVTDNDFRNRAIKNVILRTNEFEFVTFTPTEISGLPKTGAVGQSYTFQMTGDLTVADVTKPVTFDVTLTPISETRIEGKANAAILHRDFNLSIPDSPAVDTVADEVRLELDFVAVPVG